MPSLTGQVEALQLLRENWGRLLLLHGSDRELAVVTGTFLGVQAGDSIEVHGDWVRHPRYGLQFKAQRVVSLVPSDASGVIEWLMSRLPNVGRKLATEMVQRWGIPGIWDVLERGDSEALTQVRGITEARARILFASYRKYRAERDEMVVLRGWGLTDRQIQRVLAAWGEDAIPKLREDPFQLIRCVTGFGFQRASEVADRMGMPADHPARIRAALIYTLEGRRSAGDVFVPVDRLVAMGQRLLRLSDHTVRVQVRPAVRAGALVARRGRIYLKATAVAERDAVRHLLRFRQTESAAHQTARDATEPTPQACKETRA